MYEFREKRTTDIKDRCFPTKNLLHTLRQLAYLLGPFPLDPTAATGNGSFLLSIPTTW